MAESKTRSMPDFSSLGELVEFFETHDLGEYWDEMPAAHFDINIKKRTHLVAIEEDLVEELNELAKTRQISSQALVNTWLKEKLLEQTQATVS